MNEGFILRFFLNKPELGAHELEPLRLILRHKLVEAVDEFALADVFEKGRGELEKIPLSDIGLFLIGIASFAVAVVGGVVWLVGVEKSVRSVVDGKSEQRHIVGVHDAMDKADGLPLGNQADGTLADGLKEGKMGVGSILAFGVMLREELGKQGVEGGGLAALIAILKMPEAQETGCYSGKDGGLFGQLAINGAGTENKRERSGGGDIEGMERFGGDKFSNGGAPDGSTISKARIGGFAAAFELNFPTVLLGVEVVAQE